MPGERVEDEATAAPEDFRLGADREQRADPSAFSPLPGNLDCNVRYCCKRFERRARRVKIDLIEDGLQQRRSERGSARGCERILAHAARTVSHQRT